MNLPARLKHSVPDSLHVRRGDMPILEGTGYRVKIVLGESNGIAGAKSIALPFTALDGHIQAEASFSHEAQKQHSAWIYAIDGSIEVDIDSTELVLQQGESLAVKSTNDHQALPIRVIGKSDTNNYFVILSGETVQESFVQQGPFAMSNMEEIREVTQRYQNGELGSLA